MAIVFNSNATIEEAVTEAHHSLYRERTKRHLSPGELVDLFDPAVALWKRGFRVETVASIGYAVVEGVSQEVVAALHMKKERVEIIAGLPVPMMRFTLAHELGHTILHPHLEILHRDLPFDKAGCTRDPGEAEANKFASGFLMPRVQVLEQFRTRFGGERLLLNQETAWLLFGVDIENAWAKFKTRRQVAHFLAQTGSFAGESFKPMYQHFRTSPIVMAIRLEELGLVGKWEF